MSQVINQVYGNLEEQPNETSAQEKGEDFQPEVEDSPSSSLPETITSTKEPQEMKHEKEIETSTDWRQLKEAESVIDCHQLKNEINPNWQRVVDLAIALCPDKVDKMDMRCTLNELVAIEDSDEKTFYLNGDSLTLQMLYKNPWKAFHDAFTEILPDYKLELKEVTFKELEHLRSSDHFLSITKMVTASPTAATNKPAPVRYVSMLQSKHKAFMGFHK